MNLFGNRSTEKKPTSWNLILICSDGLPESQGYPTEEKAREMGREQMGTGDDDYKVVDYQVKPLFA